MDNSDSPERNLLSHCLIPVCLSLLLLGTLMCRPCCSLESGQATFYEDWLRLPGELLELQLIFRLLRSVPLEGKTALKSIFHGIISCGGLSLPQKLSVTVYPSKSPRISQPGFCNHKVSWGEGITEKPASGFDLSLGSLAAHPTLNRVQTKLFLESGNHLVGF